MTAMSTSRSLVSAVLAAVYVVLASTVILQERSESSGGDWIRLEGMCSFLVTLPVSGPAERFGIKTDFRSNLHMGIAVGLTAFLVYGFAYGLGALIEKLRARFSAKGPTVQP